MCKRLDFWVRGLVVSNFSKHLQVFRRLEGVEEKCLFCGCFICCSMCWSCPRGRIEFHVHLKALCTQPRDLYVFLTPVISCQRAIATDGPGFSCLARDTGKESFDRRPMARADASEVSDLFRDEVLSMSSSIHLPKANILHQTLLNNHVSSLLRKSWKLTPSNPYRRHASSIL